ncbi:MAG: MFS transporter [Gammaproteobacteria bacterium]|nr:MFS transporter [Gammaproteobacteria bacterium]MBU1468548.1 MFS transporter [Gammaproteobacteria bacterium]MBU2023543.1 MFS transporter [Gammaproteobacteria bacterium]MBU2240080.1 MFS transporter [Gammaproteobacteria bacterium]MBU2317316.1 MFS transporter [Gammaproteobacteria bacterium]
MINSETYSSLHERLSRWLLLSCLMAVGIGQSFIFTSLPPIGREIGLADVRISTLITAGAATFVVAAFLWGGIINRIGRVRSVIIGMSSYAMTITLTGFVLQEALAKHLSAEETYYLVFGLRIIFSLGIAGVLPSVQTYLIAHTDIKHRSSTIAMIGAAFSIGMILGPAFASLLSSLGLTAPFYIIAFLAGSIALLVVFFVKDTKHVRQFVKPPKINWLTQPVMPFLCMSSLSILSMTGVQQIMSFLIQDRFQLDVAQTTHQLGFAMMTMSCFSILVQMILVPRFQLGVVTLIFSGVGVGVLAQLAFIFLDSYAGVLFAMGLFGAGFGFLFPGIVTAQTLLVKDDQQSRLASMNASMQGLGAALGPVILASLYQLGQLVPFFGLMFGLIFMLVVFMYCKSKSGHAF